ALVGSMAASAAEPAHLPGSVGGAVARPASEPATVAAAEIQRRAAPGLYQYRRHGRRLTDYRPGDLQAGSARLVDLVPGRLRTGTLGALLAHHRLRPILSHPHQPGDPGRLEQLPGHGHGLRTGGCRGETLWRCLTILRRLLPSRRWGTPNTRCDV